VVLEVAGLQSACFPGIPTSARKSRDGGVSADLVRCDIDRSPGLARQYNVSGVPHFLWFNHGNVVDSIVGEASRDRLLSGMPAVQ
jgi:thioredoxin-like negative regulator of GroEL